MHLIILSTYLHKRFKKNITTKTRHCSVRVDAYASHFVAQLGFETKFVSSKGKLYAIVGMSVPVTYNKCLALRYYEPN